MIKISHLKIGNKITFDFEGTILTGEIIELYRDPQPVGEETDDHYYTFDVVAEVNEEQYNLSSGLL